jgi:hypothetical protein
MHRHVAIDDKEVVDHVWIVRQTRPALFKRVRMAANADLPRMVRMAPADVRLRPNSRMTPRQLVEREA